MRAYFYTHSKRINSTLQPQGSGAQYDIILKDDSGLLRPEIFLKWPGTGSPVAYNYCYIPDFGRYYWVSNWTYTERQWACSLSVDSLASHKTGIGAAEKYVLRAASDYDPHVLDKLYPATGQQEDLHFTGAISWPTNPLTGGSYVLNVSGVKNTLTIGGCGYFVCTPGDMEAIVNTAFNNIDAMLNGSPQQSGDWLENIMLWIGETFIRGTQDITQFLNSVMWLPIPITDLAPNQDRVNVFFGLVQCGTAYKMEAPQITKNMSFNLASIGGSADWEWLAPFAEYTFEMLPFGIVPLDSVAVLNYKRVNAIINLDAMSGLAVLKIYAFDGLSSHLLAERTAQMGVFIQLAGNSVDYISAVSDVIGTVTTGAALAAAGAPVLGSVAAGLGNAVHSMLPEAHTAGRSSGLGAIETLGEIHVKRLLHVPEDIAEQGRPLCKIRQLNTLPGYILCRDGDIPLAATDGELQQIEQFLTGGFFYE